ncbi:MAG: hypothetical protein SP1CHLAM54_00130 [Chlamydiia bacterium]|nr:hypothetical protein [Chlamydiia bacterium]MCH9614939.1 hypothetical protein [Chlamydiia bacterium]MCH9629887.1 hypothetical protein [Chlamydiia bacterium]
MVVSYYSLLRDHRPNTAYVNELEHPVAGLVQQIWDDYIKVDPALQGKVKTLWDALETHTYGSCYVMSIFEKASERIAQCCHDVSTRMLHMPAPVAMEVKDTFACSLVFSMLLQQTINEENDVRFCKLLTALPAGLQEVVYSKLNATPEGVRKIQKNFSAFQCISEKDRFSIAKKWLIADPSTAKYVGGFGLSDIQRFKLYKAVCMAPRANPYSISEHLREFALTNTHLFELLKDSCPSMVISTLGKCCNTDVELRVRLAEYAVGQAFSAYAVEFLETVPLPKEEEEKLWKTLILAHPQRQHVRLFAADGSLKYDEAFMYKVFRQAVSKLKVGHRRVRAPFGHKLSEMLEKVPSIHREALGQYCLHWYVMTLQEKKRINDRRGRFALDLLELSLHSMPLQAAVGYVRSVGLTIPSNVLRHLRRWQRLPTSSIREAIGMYQLLLDRNMRSFKRYLTSLVIQSNSAVKLSFELVLPLIDEIWPERAAYLAYVFDQILPKLVDLAPEERKAYFKPFESILGMMSHTQVNIRLMQNLVKILAHREGLITDPAELVGHLERCFSEIPPGVLDLLLALEGEGEDVQYLRLVEDVIEQRASIVDTKSISKVILKIVKQRNPKIRRKSYPILTDILKQPSYQAAFLELCTPNRQLVMYLPPLMVFSNQSNLDNEEERAVWFALRDHASRNRSIFRNRENGVVQAFQLFFIALENMHGAERTFYLRHLPLVFSDNSDQMKERLHKLTLFMKSQAHIRNDLSTLLTLDEVNESIVEVLQSTLGLSDTNRHNFLKRYLETLGSPVISGKFEIHVSGLVRDNTDRSRDFLQHVMERTFVDWRLAEDRSPHLRALHKPEHAAFLSRWKEDDEVARIWISGREHEVECSADPLDLFQVGNMSSSCLRPDGGGNNDCLITIPNDGKYRVVVIRDIETKMVTKRRLMPVLFDVSGNPALVVAPSYGVTDEIMDTALLNQARQFAEKLRTPLYRILMKEELPDGPVVTLYSYGTVPGHIEYVDSLGRTNGQYRLQAVSVK